MQLVDGVIELSRIEQGEVTQSLQALDVVPIVQQVLATVRAEPARPQSVHLGIKEPAAPLPKVKGDAEVIRRIIMHLVTNGVKYNREGGSVTVSFAEDRGRLAVRVSDTGIGIAQEMQPRLFTPFDRLGHENSTISGTGIGLAICQRLADLIGAEIGFESNEGTGSTFTLWLRIV